MNELSTVGELPPPANTGNNKREHGSDSPISTAPTPPDSLRQSSSPALSDAQRPIAGRRSLGTTPTPSHPTSQAPSVSSPSPAVIAGGLATPDIAGGGVQLLNNMTMQTLSAASSSSSSNPPWMTDSANGIVQAPLPFGGNMPNLNIFDLFQTDPSMFNMLDSTFTQQQDSGAQQVQQQQRSQPQQPQAQKPGPWQISDPTANMPEMIMPLESTLGDTLQMWNEAPMGFE